MLARMDVVSVNCPHTPATYHLLSARRLKLLQPHAIIVNTARGEIIDEDALADLLASGKIAGVGLDVFEFEPAINPKLLRPHAMVINTARGEVVDEAVLAAMLQSGDLAGAGLDVYEHEPSINPKLLKLPNVVLLPHMSSATIEGRIEMGEKVIINIRTWMDGHRPPDRVIPSML